MSARGASAYLLAIEAQRGKNPAKPASWAYYTSYLWTTYRLPTALMVVCQDHVTASRAENILLVLEQRGVDVPFADRQRIRHCGDLGRLRTWFIRAITATSAADVIRDE